MKKEVSYQTTKSYHTLNTFKSNTQNVWFVCHGLGQLSRYFMNHFSNLSPDNNYIIAPQAPSKFYLSTKSGRVGACWLTKEETELEQQNILQYFENILTTEKPAQPNIILGFSQGVSVALRYLKHRKIDVNHILIMSGKIPEELTTEDFNFLSKHTKVWLTYGLDDPLLTDDIIQNEILKSNQLFGNRVDIIPFSGVHEINTELITKVANY